MSILDIAKARYSVRNYLNRPVEDEKLHKILTATHVAPTAANLQPVHIADYFSSCSIACPKCALYS